MFPWNLRQELFLQELVVEKFQDIDSMFSFYAKKQIFSNLKTADLFDKISIHDNRQVIAQIIRL